MIHKVLLNIRGRQAYQDQEPDVIELVTEGTMQYQNGGWDISYEESDLTGLTGVTTTFRVEPQQITLTRRGRLNSRMVFRRDEAYDCLYQMEFGALMMRVTARQIFFDILEEGGFIDLVYDIEIENTQAGVIDYHLDIRTIA